MSSPKLVRHRLSKVLWYYMGVIPGTTSHVLAGPASEDIENSYIVPAEHFSNYEEVPTALTEGRIYISNTTGARFFVEKVFKNPDDGTLVAFGWRRFEEGHQAVAIHVMEKAFSQYKEAP